MSFNSSKLCKYENVLDNKLKSTSKVPLPTIDNTSLYIGLNPKSQGWNFWSWSQFVFSELISPKVRSQNLSIPGCLFHELINPKVRFSKSINPTLLSLSSISGPRSILIGNPTQISNGLENKLKSTQKIPSQLDFFRTY